MGSALLLYCPPLLDILPMYVVFLFLTPLVLSSAVRFGWRKILVVSSVLWMWRQFGLRDLAHNWIVHLTHLQIPLQEIRRIQPVCLATGLGCRTLARLPLRAHRSHLPTIPGWVAAFCCAACLFFVGVRWSRLGPHLTQQALGIQLDKWQIGPMRMLTWSRFRCAYWPRKYLLRWVATEPFLTLGKASLRVFCAHVVFVFLGWRCSVRDVDQDVARPPSSYTAHWRTPCCHHI